MTHRSSLDELDVLIENLTLDAYGDDEQISGFLVGADEALRSGESARIVGVDVEVLSVDAGLDARAGLLAKVRRQGQTHEVALADLEFPPNSELGTVVAAYRRWQGRSANAERSS